MYVFIRLYLWTILLGSGVCLQAQVFEGDLKINTQTELDGFAYTEIRGNLEIEHNSSDNPHDLLPLLMLESINGDLILDNSTITSLSGLDSVRQIGGILHIQDAEISSLTPLSNLQTLGGLKLINLPKFKSLDGLAQIPDSMRAITLKNLPQLESLIPLQPLQYLHEGILLAGLNALQSWTGLDSLRSCQSFYLAWTPPQIDNLRAFATLKVRQSLTLGGPNLVHLDGFYPTDSLESLYLHGLDQVADWAGLQSLVWANHIHLDQIESADLRMLGSLQGAIQSLWIEDFRGSSLAGLEGLQEVETLLVEDGRTLTNLKGLDGVQRVGTLQVDGCETLHSLEGLDQLTSAHSIQLFNLLSLNTLKHLNQLSFIGYRLDMSWLPSLEGIDGFANLSHLTDPVDDRNYVGLKIEHNDKLKHLHGFASLTEHFATGMRIRDNAMLNDISGLSGVTSVGGNTQIQSNPQLSDCCILREWFDNRGEVVIEIGDNAEYCDGSHIVEDQGICQTGIPTPTLTGSTIVPDYPNPTSGPFTISYFSEGPVEFVVQFYDRLGRAVPVHETMPAIAGWNEHTMDLSALTPGLYLYRVEMPFIGKAQKVLVTGQ